VSAHTRESAAELPEQGVKKIKLVRLAKILIKLNTHNSLVSHSSQLLHFESHLPHAKVSNLSLEVEEKQLNIMELAQSSKAHEVSWYPYKKHLNIFNPLRFYILYTPEYLHGVKLFLVI
jgi:hypothetical protein